MHSFPCIHCGLRDPSTTSERGNFGMFIPSRSHTFSSASMDRDGTSPSVYNNNDEFDATRNFIDAKMDAQMEELKVLINNHKRSSSSSRRHSSARASELPSPARSHRHRQIITDKNVKVKSSTPTTALRLHHLPWHLRQATSRHLRLWMCGIFADKHLKNMLKRSFPSSSPSYSHELL